MKILFSKIKEALTKKHGRTPVIIWIISDLGAWTVFGIGVSSLSGYFIHNELLYRGWVVYSPAMSFQTAICMIIIGVLLLTSHRIK